MHTCVVHKSKHVIEHSYSLVAFLIPDFVKFLKSQDLAYQFIIIIHSFTIHFLVVNPFMSALWLASRVAMADSRSLATMRTFL